MLTLGAAIFSGLVASAPVDVTDSPLFKVAPVDLLPGWQETDLVEAPEQLTFSIRAKEQNMDTIKEIAMAVSDPRSTKYGQFLSQAEIDSITQPRPEDVAVISSWLETVVPEAQVDLQRNRTFIVSATVEEAEALFNTNFRQMVNHKTQQSVVRAGAYSIPLPVSLAADAIFGVQGLPLPPKKSIIGAPGQPADVTPAVIAQTYGISGVEAAASSGNRQAVAEFQGQTMSSKDLSAFFTKFVKNAKPGDDKVSKFVGDPGDKSGQVEASLDIQYIMGTAVGVATEFWLYNPTDFCADLQKWTGAMLADDDTPLVFSISYGWQGNLTQIGCKDAEVNAVDSDFAKLATKGISIIFASGDSGSGYAPPHPNCNDLKQNTQLEGTVERTVQVPEAAECCEISASFKGFSYDGPSGPSPNPLEECQKNPPNQNVALEGHAIATLRVNEVLECCQISREQGRGYNFETATKQCTIFSEVTGTAARNGVQSHKNPARSTGTCTQYSTVTGSSAKTGVTSGTTSAAKVVLWPSWPASSPWVTSVGATRFQEQQVGQPEMATDQFGSGGGFSFQFPQDPNAKYQEAAVANYLKVVPKSAPFPPEGSFPATGRGTPDISALGEGFQVYNNNQLISVGGTSASAPLFAGVVSLLNEARLQKGKKQLGFLNPFIYQNSAAFTDVTVGTNAIGRGNGPLPYGFNCTTGWDPATGYGTPKFAALLTAATSAP